MSGVSKKVIRNFVDELAAVHYNQLSHSGYYMCTCALAQILRKMAEVAKDNRGRRRKAKAA